MSRKRIPIQLERGEDYIKSYNTRQTQVVTVMTAGSGLTGSIGALSDKGAWGVVVVLLLVAGMLALISYGFVLMKYKAHLTTKRLVFTEPKKEAWAISLADIKAICTGEGKEKKTLYIDIGDDNIEQNKLVVSHHMKVASEIAGMARKCGARLK